MKRIILVRHGTTKWVDEHRLQGISDIPLNENGIQQARKTAAALKSIRFDAVYTSPLSRCRQTAEIICEQADVQPVDVPGLKEINFGWLEGVRYRDHSAHDYGPLVRFYDRRVLPLIRALSGESNEKFIKRVLASWEPLMDERPRGTILVVGHWGVIKTILTRYFGPASEDSHDPYTTAPNSITEIVLDEEGRAELVRYNDTAHL